MATTTKKSPVRKTTKSAATKKAVKKSPVKKTVAKKAPAKTTQKVVTTAETKVVKSVALTGVKKQLKKLNQWNWLMALLYAGQAVALFLLANKYYYPITTNYLTSDVLSNESGDKFAISATRNVLDINIVYLLTALLALSAIFHVVTAFLSRRKYESQLERGFNKFRWLQYAITNSLLLLIVAMVAGVSDVSTMLLIAGSVIVSTFASLLIELNNRQSFRSRIPGFIRVIATLLPWLVVAEYIKGTLMYGDGGVEQYVYYIIGSVFVLNIVALVNAKLISDKKGKWSDYLYGEETYILISFVAASAITWQIFASLLR